MARIEVELDDKGEIVGDTPEALKAIFTRTEAAAHGQGYSKGMSEAAKAAQKQIEDNVKAELAKREALAPLEKEKWARIEEENTNLKTRIAEAMREADRTLKAREESHAREILQRSEALTARNKRIEALLEDQLEYLALASGARDESLGELKVILKAHIAYTDEMEPWVKGDDGQPRLLHGKPIPLKAFVKEYLESHPHHRKPPQGVGGRAPGGATFHGYSREQTVNMEAAKKRIDEGDRSPGAIDNLWQAITARKASG